MFLHLGFNPKPVAAVNWRIMETTDKLESTRSGIYMTVVVTPLPFSHLE
jgi:hypothetical protein